MPNELIKIIRNYCPKCDRCQCRTPFLGKIIKSANWSGSYMSQIMYCSIYHKKGWDYPVCSREMVYETCHGCSMDFIYHIAFKSFRCIFSVEHNFNAWCDNSIITFTRYDSRLHKIFIEILKIHYPDKLDNYLDRYDWLVNFTRK